MGRSMNKDRAGVIKKSKMLTATKDENGITTYLCNENKHNAKEHPPFASRKEARRHIMKAHLNYNVI